MAFAALYPLLLHHISFFGFPVFVFFPQTTDKNTGIESVPLFNSKMELMEFAIPVYGKEVAESKVLATDLEVVVTNMLRGPAGRLRRARFFSDASGLTWMDKQAKKNRKS